jgi:hypothetical protein
MLNWKNACSGDQKRLKGISMILANHPWFIDEIFHPSEPSLKTSSEALLCGRSSGEKVLIRLSIDAWNGKGKTQVTDLDRLDDTNFENVMNALKYLRTI